MPYSGSSSKSSNGSKKPFVKATSDWNCTECKNLNFARRTHCNRCNKERDVNGEKKKALGMEIGKLAAEKSKGLFNEKDWSCTKCGNVNWARRSQCNICNFPKYTNAANEERTGLGGGFNERGTVEYNKYNSSDEEFDEFGRRKKKLKKKSEHEKNRRSRSRSKSDEKGRKRDDSRDRERRKKRSRSRSKSRSRSRSRKRDRSRSGSRKRHHSTDSSSSSSGSSDSRDRKHSKNQKRSVSHSTSSSSGSSSSSSDEKEKSPEKKDNKNNDLRSKECESEEDDDEDGDISKYCLWDDDEDLEAVKKS